MAKIRKIYEDKEKTTVLYPQTHEKAVVDDNGTTLESKLQTITELVNQKQMEVGSVPSDLTPTYNSSNWVTSGGVFAAIKSAKEELAEFVSEVDLTDRFYLTRYNDINSTVGGTSRPLYYTSKGSGWAGAYIPCEEGDKFSISANRDGAGSQLAFLDASNKTIIAYGRNTAYSNDVFTAPANAKYLVVNASIWVKSLKKVFSTPVKESQIGIELIKYHEPLVYGNQNTRNGNVSLSSTGIMTSSEGDATSVKTDNIWMPKDTRITFHVEDESITVLGTEYIINTSNSYTYSTAGTYSVLMAEDGVLTFKFTRANSAEFTPSDMTSYVKIERPFDSTVEDYNEDKLPLMFCAARTTGSQATGALNNVSLPMFCVVTDVHSSWKQLERVLDFADSRSEIIGTLFLGDINASTGYSTSNGQQYKLPWNDMIRRHTKPLFRVSGNHDSNLTRAQYMATWFPSDIVEKTGETHPEGCPWWYIDFSITFNSVTKKLRIIGNFDNDSGATDPSAYFGTSDAQYTWICERLAECDSSTYVVILRHYSTIDVTESNLITDWRMKSKYWSPTGDSEHNQGKLCGIVNAWMYGQSYSSGNVSYDFTSGGNKANQFLCYLTGHWHKDYILKHPTYPQIDIAQCCTAVTASPSYRFNRGDLPIETTGKNMDAFNVVAFNWYNREVKLIRIGSDVTVDLRDRKVLTLELPSVT